jgi:capsid protein
MSATNFDPMRVINERPWFERALGAVAPSWELRRMQARVQKHLFEYQAAQADRIFAPKQYGYQAESGKVARDRTIMMFESRDLVENFGPAKVLLTKFAENIAPTEYAPQTGDRDYDLLVADYFHAWAKKCDFLGVNSFKKLVEVAVMTRPVDGDCGIVIRRMGDGDLRLQLVAGDRIGNPSEVAFSETYFSGITVDSFGRPVKYRIYRINRAGQYVDSEEVAAADFAHYFDPFRSDQYRGVTDFHSVLRTARMLKDILDAEQVGVKFASQQAALVYNEQGVAPTRNVFTPSPQTTLPTGTAQQEEYSQYGFIRYLTRGDKVEVMPSRPGSAFQGFTDLLMDQFALGLGVPRGVLFGTQDFKGPSVRAEFAQADRSFNRHKGILCDKVLDPIKNAVLLNAIAREEIPPPPRQPGENAVVGVRKLLRGGWRFPARLTIDVGRESDAKINEHQAGLRSAQEIAAEENADAFERLEQNAQIAAEVKRLAEKYDVPETTIKLITKTLPSTPAAAAAIGEKVGEDAAEAQAASQNAGNGPESPENKPSSAEDDDEEEQDTVEKALNRGKNRRSRALGALLERAKRLSEMRQKLGENAKSGAEIEVALARVGYQAPPPSPAEQIRVVTTSDARAMLTARLDAEKKLAALVESIGARREKLNGSAKN